jgi:hypothetical protein
MQHGDIHMRISLSGEPQKLLTYWRGSLRDMLPTMAGVSITRPLVKPRRTWLDVYNPSLYFEGMTRTEKKRADLSISEQSLKDARAGNCNGTVLD